MDKVFIFVLCFYFCLAKITIKNLNVPSSISVREDEVILDCEFDDQDGDVEEVKWFYDGLVKQIYQWLPKRNMKPQALGEFRDKIDINYKATQNTTTMYRALKLTKLTPELSGDYTCKVSGLKSEDYKTKKMIIYDPADYDLELNATRDDDNLTIECYAEGIFPEPEMRLLIAQYNESNVVIEHDEEVTELNEDESYNITSILHLDLDDLDSPIYYTCELTIPGTDYELNDTGIFYFESETDTQSEEDNEFVNSINSTETSLEELQEIETQIEENSEIALNATAANNNDDDDDDDDDEDDDDKDDNDIKDKKDDDDDDDDDDNDDKNSEDSASFRHLPSLSLLSTLFFAVLGSSFL